VELSGTNINAEECLHMTNETTREIPYIAAIKSNA
jgi:hypothetical protein